MTDKQIIIDGVDVSKCEYWSGSELGYCNIGLWANDGTHICECEQDCYYKQFKRKENECENNKIAHQTELDIYNQECLNLQEELKETLEQLDQLKAEIEVLKQYKASKQASYESMQREWNEAVNENRELKQTLAEIKEIIHFNKTNRLSGVACISIEQILQKISECEVE